MRVGIDDTDSPEGGCTTWTLTELVRVAREHRLDLLGEPHLVRLNPNVPWKTRGNAALAVRVGRGSGPSAIVGELDGRPVRAYLSGRGLAPSGAAEFLDDAWSTVLASARSEAGTDPALVASAGPLPAAFYRRAVRERVTVAEAQRVLRAARAYVRVRSGRRGLIGATAAVAWPGRRSTWEAIAYRGRAALGTPRRVERASVADAARRHPELFLCHDPRTRRLLVAPHTPCPILFGLRGTTPDAPRKAMDAIRSEPYDRWMLFRTNQATGDHLVRRPVAEVRGYRSAIVRGIVDGPVSVLPGGHVRFGLRDRAGDRLRCLVFEPTKTLPEVARALVPGDLLEVWGSRGATGAFHLEGVTVVGLVPAGHLTPPSCRGCSARTRSLGTGRGWRCDRCRRRFPPEAARWTTEARSLAAGTYHPTPSARRHLAPLAIPPSGPPPAL